MIRISTMFVAFCVVLIAASLGLLLHTVGGVRPMQAAIVAAAALTLLILYNVVSMRQRGRTQVGGQIADLSRGTAELARQVAEFGRRLHAVENKITSASASAERRVDPLREEIAELGNLVKQIAESVATHEELLASGPAPAQQATTAPTDDPASIQPVPSAASGPRKTPTTAPMIAAVAVAAVSSASGSATPDDAQVAAAVRSAVDANRIDIYLQPLVTLPQRKVRFYEALSRLRDSNDTVIPAAAFIEAAEKAGTMPRIDEAVVLRCVQVLRRLMVRNKDIGLFCNMSASTLRDTAVFARCLDFLDANRALAPFFALEFKQSAFRNLGPLETEHLAALAQRGFRFSIDNVTDLRFDARELADRGVRFIKIPAMLLLDSEQAAASDIHPSDLSDMLGRYGIDLVAERIEAESSVVDLLDFDVRFGQGFLFSPPRPLRIDATNAPAAAAPDAPPPPAPAASRADAPARAQGLAALARRSGTN